MDDVVRFWINWYRLCWGLSPVPKSKPVARVWVTYKVDGKVIRLIYR